MTLDAANEFDGVDAAEAAAKEAADKAAADKATADKEAADLKGEVGSLKQTLTEKLAEVEGLKSKTAILDKLSEVFGGKPVDKQDEFITNELRRRLGGDLSDVAKIKAILPVLLEMVGSQAEEKLAERVESAQDVLRTEMEKLGLDPDDEDTFTAMEEAVTSVIRRDDGLSAAWAKGNAKKAVSEAFEKLQTKLYAPIRSRLKRSAVNSLLDGPKPSPRGGAASAPKGKESNTVDTSDVSRAGLKKVHDAAFDRLQELIDN